MDRIQFVEYLGKDILSIDLSEASSLDEMRQWVEAGKAKIIKEPEGSLLTITDVSGNRFNNEVFALLKDFAEHNKPYVKAAALIGISGLQQIGVNLAAKATGRKFQTCDDREQAMKWLCLQDDNKK